MIRGNRATLFCYSLFTIAMFSGCGPKQSATGTAGQVTGSVKVDGSSTVYPVTEAVAEELRTVHPGIQVTVGISGTGAA